MAIDYRISRFIYKSIRNVDIWMGYRLDKEHHMIIRKHGFQYHIYLYHNGNLVDEGFVMKSYDPNENMWIRILSICFKILKWWLVYVGIWYYVKMIDYAVIYEDY